MKPTSDEFKPRRDGYFEHRAQWGEVVIGTLMPDPSSRVKIWEVVDQAHGKTVDYGMTLYMRIREVSTGVEHTIRPRLKTHWTSVLTRDPADTVLPPASGRPSDAEAILEVANSLGGVVMSWIDSETGEVQCPDHAYIDGSATKWMIDHLRRAHKLSVDDGADPNDLVPLHSQAHNPAWPNIGKDGYPHRHVPEDLSFL